MEETQAKASVMRPRQQSLDPREREGAGGTRPGASRGSASLPTPWFWTSGLRPGRELTSVGLCPWLPRPQDTPTVI